MNPTPSTSDDEQAGQLAGLTGPAPIGSTRTRFRLTSRNVITGGSLVACTVAAFLPWSHDSIDLCAGFSCNRDSAVLFTSSDSYNAFVNFPGHLWGLLYGAVVVIVTGLFISRSVIGLPKLPVADWLFYMIAGGLSLVAALLEFVTVGNGTDASTGYSWGPSFGSYVALPAAAAVCAFAYLRRGSPPLTTDKPASPSARLAGRIVFVFYGILGGLWLLVWNSFASIEGDFEGSNGAVVGTGLLVTLFWVVVVIVVIARPRRPAMVSVSWMALFLGLDFGWLLVGGEALRLGQLGGPDIARNLIFVVVSIALALITLLPAVMCFGHRSAPPGAPASQRPERRG